MSDIPILFTPVQTAKIMGISRSQVYNLLKSGELNSVYIGRQSGYNCWIVQATVPCTKSPLQRVECLLSIILEG